MRGVVTYSGKVVLRVAGSAIFTGALPQPAIRESARLAPIKKGFSIVDTLLCEYPFSGC